MSHVITILQLKGGSGKTTFAAHLAVAFSQKGQRVALVDVYPEGTLTQWHRRREEHFGQGFTGVHFSSLNGWRVASEIDKLKREYSVIIIDTPPHTEIDTKTAIRAANQIIIPVQPTPADLWGARATLELIARENAPAYFLLNRMTKQTRLAREIEDALTHEKATRLEVTLGNRVAFAACMEEGRSVTETDPRSPAAEEIKAVTKEISALIAQAAPKLEPAPIGHNAPPYAPFARKRAGQSSLREEGRAIAKKQELVEAN